MKRSVILPALLILAIAALGQATADSVKSSRYRGKALEFAGGIVIPLGNFASQDKDDEKSGYALPGYQARITFDWMGKGHFGLGASYIFQRNAMENMANKCYPNGLPEGEDPGAWSNHYLLIGPVFVSDFSRFQLNTRLLAGGVVSAGKIFDTRDPVDSTGLTINSNLAAGLAIGLQAGIGYMFSDRLSLGIQAALMGGWPAISRQYSSQLIGYETYKDPYTGLTMTRPVYSAPVIYEIKKVVGTFNCTLGLTYRF